MIPKTDAVREGAFKVVSSAIRIRAKEVAFDRIGLGGWKLLLVALLSGLAGISSAQALDPAIRQLAISVPAAWNTAQGKLQLFDRVGETWKPNGEPIPVLYGKNGLVWGRGVFGTAEPGVHKREHDGRAPAGVFRIGTIYTYDASLPTGADYPFCTVGKNDAWVDDPALPEYNRHVRIDPRDPPPWFEKQKMRHADFAYRWLVEIRHNSDPPEPGAGSAIFFHIRRGATRPTAGCTSMEEANLVRLIRWLRAEKNPHYVLLPREAYEQKWHAWGLPAPTILTDLTAPGG